MPPLNYYASPNLERAGLRRRDLDWIRQRIVDPASVFVPVWRTQNLVAEEAGGEPRAALVGAAALAALLGAVDDGHFERGEIVFLGVIDEKAHFALDLSAHEAPLDRLRSPAAAASGLGEAAMRFTDLRTVGARLDRRDGALLAFGRAMLFWHSRHRFCGLCGSLTRSEEAGHMRRCTSEACKAMHFPRTDPAVIMLVTDGERALLGRQKQFPPGIRRSPALSNPARASNRRWRARCARRPPSRSAPSSTIPRNRGRFRPTSCSAFMPRR
jgi:NAD+ diphosphatase